MHYSTLISFGLLLKLSTASYVLEDDYTSNAFFSFFTFFTAADPTNGYVHYVDQGTAQNTGLLSIVNNQVHIGVDSNNVATGSGRNSVRITSNKSYNHGLFILDLAHMPGGVCWLVGPDWPNQGEIDIIEGVNDQTNNAMTLHTSDGCTIVDSNAFTGTLATSNCYINAPGQATNAGCDIQSQDSRSYGAGFNAIGGGVIATEWTSDVINIWFFPRGTTPADISNGVPNPATWGAPVAQFDGSCDIDSHFQNQQIVFDTTFCGDWAGAVWSSSAKCAALAPTCQSYVQNNPGAFADMYWLINSLKVYQSTGASNAATAVHQLLASSKNETLPLSSEPLAMGGSVPVSKRRRVGRK
ncbi:MAG: hypothetical protein HETSPECPRED_006683 [Heterodermia speciosa]|uniref:endo-1,3(4)-beta-glucanase n=1 Tax=Heterodermia speciosa TaxID=116794 RepID=A0A8H3FKV9_9LECA|nr:MAG: hypothetical protein HETSPECPRED_006683 [Heterodermia speciosa]